MTITYRSYLDADHHIFPLHPIVNGACGCGNPECKALGKHPVMSNWQYVTTWDEEQLANLEDDYGITGVNRLENFGVNLHSKNLLVVDIDARNGGVESAQQISHIVMASAFVVKTGSGNGSKHAYFRVPEAWQGKALRAHLDHLKGIDFKSTGFVVGCGSVHASGNYYEALIGEPSDIGDAPDELLQMLHIPEKTRSVFEGRTIEYSDQELANIVMAIRNDGRDYEKWIRVGMGIHHATGGSGYELWRAWSAQCKEAHDETDMMYKWHSFGKSASTVTIGTLLTWAKHDGYETPVTFTDDTEWEPVETPQTDQPETTAGINLMKPPGLVGQITEWINSRSIYPRETLAVAGALQIVSNIASLRYRVAPLNTSLNMITFGVAGSGSGKGIIIKCINEVMRKVGLSEANYGGIKSEQEIIRNAMRHQASFFTIDEVGDFLSKIGGAKKSGGRTPYLENVSTKIMELYSASNEIYAISGDLKREMREEIDKEIARVNKRMDKDGETAELQQELESLLQQREAAKHGIAYPITAFFGISEPHSFNEATNDYRLLIGGFLGRALVFEEIDSVPLRKPFSEISHDDLPEHITMQLMQMYNNGHASSQDARIEQKGDKAMITMTEGAQNELDRVYMYWHKRGKKEQDDGTGLSSLTNRATELTIKVAGTLAAETLVMTVEHVRWAYALVKKVTDMKISKAKALVASESRDTAEKGDGLIEAIRSVLMVGDYHTIGVIANRFRTKYSKADIQAGLDEMVQRGIVKRVEALDSCNRKQVRYSMDK